MVTTILEAQCRSRRWGATGGGVPLLGARSGRGLRETTVGWWMSRRSRCIGIGGEKKIVCGFPPLIWCC